MGGSRAGNTGRSSRRQLALACVLRFRCLPCRKEELRDSLPRGTEPMPRRCGSRQGAAGHACMHAMLLLFADCGVDVCGRGVLEHVMLMKTLRRPCCAPCWDAGQPPASRTRALPACARFTAPRCAARLQRAAFLQRPCLHLFLPSATSHRLLLTIIKLLATSFAASCTSATAWPSPLCASWGRACPSRRGTAL